MKSRIFAIEIFQLDENEKSTAVGFTIDNRTSPEDLVELFAKGIEDVMLLKNSHSALILSMLVTAVENIKANDPGLATTIRKANIDFIKAKKNG